MKNGYDHHEHQDIYTYNLSGPKRFTLDVPIQSPPYPRFLRVLGWFWFQILVAASDLTKIDTRQKDLQLSDA